MNTEDITERKRAEEAAAEPRSRTAAQAQA